MNDKNEALKQALECIERLNKHGWILADFEDEVYATLASLKAALEQQAEPVGFEIAQPVAWRFKGPKDGHWLYTTHIVDLSKKYWRLKNELFEPLYTAPPLPVQEPIGEVVEVNNDGFKCEFSQHLPVGTKLYTTPPLPVQEPDRRALQAEGKHPAPCARHCEAKAFEIEIRSLKSALKQAQPEPPTCAWSPEDDDTMPGTYRSACGELWSFIDGGWQDNNVRFCHGCGGKVEAAHNIKENT